MQSQRDWGPSWREDIAKGVEERSAVKGLEVNGADRVVTDQGVARETREPGGTVRTTVQGGAKRGRSQSGADWLTVRGGVMNSAPGGQGIPLPKRTWRLKDLRQIHAAELSQQS